MKVNELLENDDWTNAEVPASSEGATKHYTSKVQGITQELSILRAQRSKFLGDPLNFQNMPQSKTSKIRADLLTKKIDALEAKLKHEFKVKIGDSKITNPLVSCQLAHYVGPPDQYPDLTTTQKDLYAKIQAALANAGIPPLSILYGGRHTPAHKAINFLAVNANNTVAWRKAETTPGGGSNHVYVAGVGKIDTPNFVYKPNHYLDKIAPGLLVKQQNDEVAKAKPEFW